MTVLIVGATGLIGKQLVNECLSKGWQVHFLTTRRDQINQLHGAKGFFWSIDKALIDEACFEGVSVIVNLAGTAVSLPWKKSIKRKILDSRVNGAGLIYEALSSIKHHQVTRYIGASGISGYSSDLERWYDETYAADAPTFLGDVVRQWEAAAQRFESLEIDVAVVRTGLVLANNGGVLTQITQPIKMGLGAVLGHGKQWQSWIHINDIVGIYTYLMTAQGRGVYNGVAPNPVTHDTMTHAIAVQCRRKIILPKAPGCVLKVILGERSALVLESQCVAPQRLLNDKFKFAFSTLDEALEDLLPQ